MQMQHILSLVALSEAGSIRSAAASLWRSQPGLTKNLRQIEDELGARLFQRTSRGVIPTKIGQLVLARTRTIATDIRRLQEEVEQTKGGQHGTPARRHTNHSGSTSQLSPTFSRSRRSNRQRVVSCCHCAAAG